MVDSTSEIWDAPLHGGDQSVESIDLRSGATLILSQFGAGETRRFRYTEPEDTFGFGFHLKGGARFDVEGCHFETRAADVWAAAAPRGSTSHFVLPSGGFRTVAIRFDPESAEDLFAGGSALPSGARGVLRRASEDAGVERLAPLTAATVSRLSSMFTTPYCGVARRLYLESCAFELLAGQVATLSGRNAQRSRIKSSHRQKALAARDHLDGQLQNPPTISELSRIVGTNEFTLKQAFKETLGTTVFAYVSRRRMEHATFLLQQGMTVALAAEEVGYRCVRSFSAAFRRQVGCAPSVIRRTGAQILPIDSGFSPD